MFIVFEGVDGSGKSTQTKLLANTLKEMGFKVVLTREVGGTDFGNQCREILMSNKKISTLSQLLLINAARVEHLENVIKPALANGKIVICDRYIDSTLVYQGQNEPTILTYIDNLHKEYCNNFMPDITFFLSISKNTMIKRILERNESVNFFDNFAMLNCDAMQEAYRNIYKYKQQYQNICELDGNKQEYEILNDVLIHLWNFIK